MDIHLSSLLIGRAIEEYCRLTRYEMNDYPKHKQVLLMLLKFFLTEEHFRKTFFNCKGLSETAS